MHRRIEITTGNRKKSISRHTRTALQTVGRCVRTTWCSMSRPHEPGSSPERDAVRQRTGARRNDDEEDGGRTGGRRLLMRVCNRQHA